MKTRGATTNDRILLWGLRGASVLASSIVLLIVYFLLAESLPALRRIGIARFVTDGDWLPSTAEGENQYRLVPMLAATLLSTLGAVLIAAPAGLLSAVFCHFYAPKALATFQRRIVELLAGIPSVVYGFWGLVTLVPILQRFAPPGQNLLAGILVLTLMILPTIAMLASATLATIPQAHLQGAAALGLSRWTTLRGVVLPEAAPGLLIALLLGTMRAVGETMAVLMVCGNVVQIPTSLSDPVRTLTANIALEMGYATSEHRSVLFVSGLALMALVVLLIGLQRQFRRSVTLV